jgi:flavorubredoxin
MWGSTEKMAKAVLNGIVDEGVSTKLYRLTVSDNSDIVEELLEARGLLVGSPILNNGIFPKVAEFSTYVKGLRPRGKIGGVFGSYGWGPNAIKALDADFKAAGVDMMESLQVQFVPDTEALQRCEEWGRAAARKIKAASAGE